MYGVRKFLPKICADLYIAVIINENRCRSFIHHKQIQVLFCSFCFKRVASIFGYVTESTTFEVLS